MQLPADLSLQSRLLKWSRYLAVTLIAVALIVLLGWQLDVSALRSFLPGLVAMNPLSAICFFLLGIALQFAGRTDEGSGQRPARALALIVVVVGIAQLLSLYMNSAIHIDQLLYTTRVKNAMINGLPNRMAPNTAVCFVLSGIALWLVTMKQRTPIIAAQYICLATALVGWLSLLGYVYQVESFYGIFRHVPMSVLSALSFLLFSLGIFFLRPGRGFMKQLTTVYTGSLIAKLIIPAAIIVPSVFGFLRLYGDWEGLYSSEFGVALYSTVIILIFLILGWFLVVQLNKKDILKDATEAANQKRESEVAAIFFSAPDAVILIDGRSIIQRWNPEAEKLFGWTKSEILGRDLTETIIPEEFRAAHREGMRRYLSTGEHNILGRTVDVVALRKDGSTIDVALRISPLTVDDNNLFVGFVRDISEQKGLARKLETFNEELTAQVEAKKKELNEIFERLTDGYIAVDKNFRFTYVNARAAELSQKDKSEMLGRYAWDVFPEGIGSATHAGYLKAMQEQVHLVVNDYYEPLDLYQENHIYPTAEGLSVFIRDTTNKKRAELALIEKETKYRTLFDEAADAILVVSPEGKYLEANRKACELLGYSLEEFLQMDTQDLKFADDVVPTPLRELNKGHLVRIERNLRKKNGEPIAVETIARKMPDSNILAFIRDVTERKKAEKAILDARELSDKLIDSLPGVFYFFDDNGHFLRWNRQLESVTGYSAEEIASMHPTDFFPEDEKGYISDRIEGVFVKGVNDAEAHLLAKNGTKIPYYFRAVLVNYEGQLCLLGNGIDMSEQKAAVTQLKLSEQKYKLLFQSNPQPMFMLTLPDYNIIEVNTSALGQYGYSKDEFVKLSIFDLRPAEDVEKFKASTDIRFRSIHHAGIWRHKRKDGTIIYVDISTHDVYYENRPVRLVLATDVTEKYEAEEKLRKSYESIRHLTEHLQNIREEERTHIAREIHDELGQQLTVLKMDVAWLNKKIENPSPQVVEKMKDLLGMLDTTVKTVRRISSELRPSLLDDLGLIPAMEWHLEEFQKRSGIEQQMIIPDRSLELSDELKIALFRIFQESLTNVARHADAKKVDIRLEKKDKKVILTIADDGRGFNEEHASKKTLGILGMKERTLMLGGNYTIKGTPGKGTVVSVSVPLNGALQKNQEGDI